MTMKVALLTVSSVTPSGPSIGEVESSFVGPLLGGAEGWVVRQETQSLKPQKKACTKQAF
jgi:hypothetical protein